MDGQENRTRKKSEKGLLRNKEVKKVESAYKQLLQDYDKIRFNMEKNPMDRDRVEEICLKYASWLKLYGCLFEIRLEYSNLLNDTEQSQFDEVCKTQNVTLSALKSIFEQFFLLHGSEQQGSETSVKHSIVSSERKSVASRYSSSSRSNVSSAVLREKQKQAELQAKVKALREKQELDKSKFELKMKEEELGGGELKTEISQAKSKVLHEFECDQLGLGSDEDQFSQQLDINLHNMLDSDKLPSPTPASENMKVHNQPSKQVSFLPSSPNSSLHDQTAVSSNNVDVIHSVVQQLRKPSPEIQKFSGDPLEYQRFKRQFHIKIVANSDSVDERMSYLEQFTVGEALRIVKGYSYLNASRGYEAAWNELDDRCGNEEAIASALIKRALSWPSVNVNSPKALDDYAIFLQECMNAVTTINAVKILEYPDNLRKLIMKLPFSYQEKWRNVVLQVRNTGRLVDFQDLVEFVKREAKKVMDPMFGTEALKLEDKGKLPVRKVQTTTKPVTRSSFGTNVQTPSYHNKEPFQSSFQARHIKQTWQELCIFCNEGSHSVKDCKTIVLKPHAERLSFLKLKGLCFRCLQPGHMSKGCSQLVTCSVCKGNHQSILHVDRNTEVKEVSACAELSNDPGCFTEAGNTECTLAIIPVKVTYKNGLAIETTYAFLDPVRFLFALSHC